MYFSRLDSFEKKVLTWAGIEPESPAWQLAALTTQPPGRFFSKIFKLFKLYLTLARAESRSGPKDSM